MGKSRNTSYNTRSRVMDYKYMDGGYYEGGKVDTFKKVNEKKVRQALRTKDIKSLLKLNSDSLPEDDTYYEDDWIKD